MPSQRTREVLELLVGKTITGVSHTDHEENLETGDLHIYLFLEDGSVFRFGPTGFTFFKPGEYQADY